MPTQPDGPALRAQFEALLDLDLPSRHEALQQLAQENPKLAAALTDLFAIDAAQTHSELAFASNFATRTLEEIANPSIEGYELLEAIGEGGMGEVYLANRSRGEIVQKVAIKRLRGISGGSYAAALLHEQKLLADLDHPGIVRWLDAGTDSAGKPWFAMNFVQGEGILDYAKKHSLSLRERIVLFRKVCEPVAYAHSRGVIHRDLKNPNVLIDTDGGVHLLDFGIARAVEAISRFEATATSERFFSLASASPEQVKGLPTSTATDLYSLGVMLYQLLSNKPPYDLSFGSPTELQTRICELPVVAPSQQLTAANQKKFPEELDRICLQLLRKDPSERYPTVDALVNDLTAFLDGRPVQAAGQNRWYLLRKFVIRHWKPLSAATLVFAALTALSVSLYLKQLDLEHANVIASAASKETTAVNAFLLDVFLLADPGNTNGEQLKVIELIDQAQARLGFSATSNSLGTLGYALGSLRIRLGDNAGVEPIVAQLLASPVPAVRSKGMELEAERLFVEGKFDLAAAAYEKALAQASASQHLSLRVRYFHALNAGRQNLESLRFFERLAKEQSVLSISDAIMTAEVLYQSPDKALGLLDRSVASEEAGGYSTSLAVADMTRARMLRKLGRSEEALEKLDRATGFLETVYGPQHSTALSGLVLRASIFSELGRYEEAFQTGTEYLDRAAASNIEVRRGEKINRYAAGLRVPERREESKVGMRQLLDGANEVATAIIHLHLATQAIREGNHVVALEEFAQGRIALPKDHPLKSELEFGESLICPERYSDARRGQLAATVNELPPAERKVWAILESQVSDNNGISHLKNVCAL